MPIVTVYSAIVLCDWKFLLDQGVLSDKVFPGNNWKTDRVNSCRNVSVPNTVITKAFAVSTCSKTSLIIGNYFPQACRNLTNQQSVRWMSLSEDSGRLETCLLSSLDLFHFLTLCCCCFCLIPDTLSLRRSIASGNEHTTVPLCKTRARA